MADVKEYMKPTTVDLIDDITVDNSTAVGIARGTCIGICAAVVLLMLGAAIPAVWRFAFRSDKTATSVVDSSPKPAGPFEASTVYKNVPFIGLSDIAIKYGLTDPNAKRLIEKQMLGREYFEGELLPFRMRYRPKLLDPVNMRSAITLNDGYIKRVVVQLVNDDGSPGRWGLISLDDYEDDLRGMGR